MNIHTVHRFGTPAYSRFSLYLTQEQQPILGVLYVSTSQATPADYKVSLALIDVQERACKYTVSYKNKGPDENVMTDISRDTPYCWRKVRRVNWCSIRYNKLKS